MGILIPWLKGWPLLTFRRILSFLKLLSIRHTCNLCLPILILLPHSLMNYPVQVMFYIWLQLLFKKFVLLYFPIVFGFFILRFGSFKMRVKSLLFKNCTLRLLMGTIPWPQCHPLKLLPSCKNSLKLLMNICVLSKYTATRVIIFTITLK
jgi:hypothetical protein